jgi:hypothetical protein
MPASFLPGDPAVLRTTSTALLILAGTALGTVLLCLVALRVVLSALIALSGIRRRMVRSGQVLDW